MDRKKFLLLLTGGSTPVSLAAAISGIGSCVGTLAVAASLSATLSGSGTLSATPKVAVSLSATLTGSGSCFGTPSLGQASVSLAATLSGSGTLSATPSVGAVTPPFDLVDAVQLRLEQLLVEPGALNWAGSGELPPGYSMPFARILPLDDDADYQEDGSGHAPYDDIGTFAVAVAATTEVESKRLRNRVEQSLNDAPLQFGDGGLLLLLRRTHRSAPALVDEDAPEGQQEWVAHLMFATIVSRIL